MGERVKVVRVIARLNIGGPARHVSLLERHLRDRGYDSWLVHGMPSEGERELAVDPSIRRVPVAALGRSVRFGSDIVAFARVLAVVFRVKPDIVHTHTAKAGAIGRLAALAYNLTRRRARRCAVIHTFHGHVFHGYFSPRMSRIVQVAERTFARVSDRIVAISEEQRRDLVEIFRIAPAAKVVVVPLGLDLESLTAVEGRGGDLRREAGFDAQDVVCGFVGRLVPIKNVGLLLRACAIAFREAPHARLLIVGDGELRPELEAQAAALGLEGRVHFSGWRSDLAGVYGAMDVVALSSRNEGTPVALIEAMAVGRAVAATNVGGVASVVTDGVTGLLAGDDDAEGLARAIGRLLCDPTDRARMGAAARADVLRRFGYPRLVGDIDALYRATLQSVRGRSVPAAPAEDLTRVRH